MSSKKITLKCPACQAAVEWSDDYPFRPFCSKRCQLVDFGDWASEKNAIPGDRNEDEIFSDDLEKLRNL